MLGERDRGGWLGFFFVFFKEEGEKEGEGR